ncbi:MAG TPA: M48 family metalloprotease [Gaiellaceae bacterium]|nr:M48 family metalloprotease [Gaiellaceae bacterium]
MGVLLAAGNILKSWLLALTLAGIFALIGWLIDGVRGLSIFAFCALLVAAGAYWSFDRVVLGMMGARELPLGEAPLLHSTVERLASRAGILKPRLYLIPDGLPIAAATGRGVRSSSLAISTGCVAACSPAELEGVLAHEIAHVRLHDVQVQTAAAVAAAILLETSRIGGWLQRSLLFLLAPIAAACVHLLVSPKREFAADRLAARLCDSPHGLADALGRLEQAAELVEFEGSPATEPMFTINPFAEEWPARLFVTHPPLAERVRRLRELDSSWRTGVTDEAAA